MFSICGLFANHGGVIHKGLPHLRGGGGVVSQKQKQIAADSWGGRLSQRWMSIEIKLIFIFYYLEILSVQCKFKFNI